MQNKKLKPIYNYDLEESNLLFKRNIRPIGCGIGDKDGRPYIVFMANRQYFDALKLIRLERDEQDTI